MPSIPTNIHKICIANQSYLLGQPVPADRAAGRHVQPLGQAPLVEHVLGRAGEGDHGLLQLEILETNAASPIGLPDHRQSSWGRRRYADCFVLFKARGATAAPDAPKKADERRQGQTQDNYKRHPDTKYLEEHVGHADSDLSRQGFADRKSHNPKNNDGEASEFREGLKD